jgi:hypothetical protein
VLFLRGILHAGQRRNGRIIANARSARSPARTELSVHESSRSSEDPSSPRGKPRLFVELDAREEPLTCARAC